MKPTKQVCHPSLAPSHGGFTLVELVTMIAVLALLALTFLPARAATRTKSDAVLCVNHLRQLMGAVTLYASDNHDFFPPNPDDGNTVLGHNWCAGQAGIGGAQEFNPDILEDPSRCLIAPYLRGNVSVFHCPADPRQGRYQGTDPAKTGAVVPAARSVSLNGGVGTICAAFDQGGGHSGKPALAVNGPWLDGSHGHRRDVPYATFGKTTDFSRLSPAQIFTLLDENPWSINDGSFAVIAATPSWVDWPGTYHENSGGFAFGDGHAEIHQWQTGSFLINGPVHRGTTVASNPDWQWEWTHATVKLY